MAFKTSLVELQIEEAYKILTSFDKNKSQYVNYVDEPKGGDCFLVYNEIKQNESNNFLFNLNLYKINFKLLNFKLQRIILKTTLDGRIMELKNSASREKQRLRKHIINFKIKMEHPKNSSSIFIDSLIKKQAKRFAN